MPALALALLLASCGGIVERDPKPKNGITALCWVECLRFKDGRLDCVTLNDPKQLEAKWWDDVVAIESDHPCPDAPEGD